jgi:cytoskeletal protein CcmA (bactofilin family)
MRIWESSVTLGLVLALVSIPALPAAAFVPRAGNTVVVADAVADDLYVAAGTINVTGDVDGDVTAVGGTITLTGPVTGGILAAGGTVGIRGSVGRNVRAAAGTLVLGGAVGTDAVLAGGSIGIERASQIGRDLVVAGGEVQLSGTVRRNARITGGAITIGGTVDGDLEAHGDRIVLLPTARIAGTLTYSADRPIEIQSGAQVAGQVTRVDRPERYRTMLNPAARLRLRFAGRILEALWLLVLGLVLVAITPRGVQTIADRMRARFGLSLLAGFVLIVVVPVASVLLLITIVGIPLALALMLLYVATLYPAMIFVSAWLGDALGRGLRRDRRISPYAGVIIGTIILVILVGLPFVGWIFRFIALCVGFGALWAAIWSARTRSQPAAA